MVRIPLKKPTHEQEQKVIDLREIGLTYVQIRKVTGMSEMLIAYIANKNGVNKRKDQDQPKQKPRTCTKYPTPEAIHTHMAKSFLLMGVNGYHANKHTPARKAA